ncbi:unnamed protein product [Ambrosiozyma monospora]|uniref:Unnamed protein product n=1 Tax=Ambrosiozyma monospora TaxID=43982 RepID=A0ACB5T9E4_AMBMO|nr:unnamed protein product [Ambrosiozyma monospora]
MSSVRSARSETSDNDSLDSKADFGIPVREKVPPPDLSPSNIVHYLGSRFTTLAKPPICNEHTKVDIRSLNPLPAIKAMELHHWNLFAHGFMAWTIDAMDFFCVSVSASSIAKSLDVNITSITWGLTLVLMLRSVGAVIFGYCGDRWGRKYPLIACYLLFVVLEIGTGFCQTLKQFLGIRSLFGIAMGGCYGLAAATAIEDAPQKSRGFLSGIFLPGYNLGYIFATVFFRAFQTTEKEWRALFWFSAGPPFLLIIWRLSFGELKFFTELQEAKRLHNQRVEEAQAAEQTGL